jgi:hypothetical protein
MVMGCPLSPLDFVAGRSLLLKVTFSNLFTGFLISHQIDVVTQKGVESLGWTSLFTKL